MQPPTLVFGLDLLSSGIYELVLLVPFSHLIFWPDDYAWPILQGKWCAKDVKSLHDFLNLAS